MSAADPPGRAEGRAIAATGGARRYDVIIVGAGPAGMAAAVEAASLELRVLLLDEQSECGGQIYRSVSSVKLLRPHDFALLGPDYVHGHALAHALAYAAVEHCAEAKVWNVDAEAGSVGYVQRGRAIIARADRIVIATGAMERPTALPGWTLPGVMGAGAAQIVLKSTGMVPDGPVVLAGGGPLLLLTALQLQRAGAQVAAVLETTDTRAYMRGAPRMFEAACAPEYLLKGIAMRRALRAARVTMLSGCSDLEACGRTELEGVEFRHGGNAHKLGARALLLHEGVIPNAVLARQVGATHRWRPRQHYWEPVTDSRGNSSVARVLIAGDGAGIFGARAAEYSGRIVALEVAAQLEHLSERECRSRQWRYRCMRWRHRSIRPLLDEVFAPRLAGKAPLRDHVMVCRCYEVSRRAIVQALERGCHSPDELKSYLRCGMGPCQGRMCGLAVANIITQMRATAMSDVGVFRGRAPAKPLTVRELAMLDEG